MSLKEAKEYTIWLSRIATTGYLIIVVFQLGMDKFSDRDSSDMPDKRSGMTIRVDALTGCQYLESRSGHLTPRIDEYLMPICGEDK